MLAGCLAAEQAAAESVSGIHAGAETVVGIHGQPCRDTAAAVQLLVLPPFSKYARR